MLCNRVISTIHDFGGPNRAWTHVVHSFESLPMYLTARRRDSLRAKCRPNRPATMPNSRSQPAADACHRVSNGGCHDSKGYHQKISHPINRTIQWLDERNAAI